MISNRILSTLKRVRPVGASSTLGRQIFRQGQPKNQRPAFSTRVLTFSPTHDDPGAFHHGDNRTKSVQDRPKRGKGKGGKTKKLFRADRVLSNRSPQWSRAECFDILKKKRVFVEEPTGEQKRILGPSEKIAMDAVLLVDGKTQVAQPPPLLRVYHKPKWVLSVMNDNHGRRHIGELQEEDVILSKMHPVGRLDYDTSGLLVFSSDGKLTQSLLHPSSGIQKEYVALVVGSVDTDELAETLKEGVETSMGTFPAELIHAEAIPTDQVATIIQNIVNNLPPEYDLEKLKEKGYLDFQHAKDLSEVRLVVEEGKHRMVRRILANSGHPVIGLKRERLGAILLNDLPEGSLRSLSAEEEEWAKGILTKKQ